MTRLSWMSSLLADLLRMQTTAAAGTTLVTMPRVPWTTGLIDERQADQHIRTEAD